MYTQELKDSTVLVIDDTPSNIAILFEYLRAYEVEVLITQDGASGIEVAENEQPDVILLDVMMPIMDGFETCRRLKADARTRDIPVLFLSALSEVVDKVKGFEVGGVDYITKPVQKEELLARISAHLKIRHQQRSLMRFFSIVSHDLRSPFNSLITVTKYVSENIDSFGKDELKEMMLSLYENTSRTLKFAENLLSWARLQNQSLRAKPRRVDPGEIARDVLGLLRGEAGRKNIDLSSDMSETAVWADHDMLHLVLRNLASNAIKFTPRGGSVTMASQRDGETVAISVTDTGVGIAPESLRDMFNVHRKTQSLGTDQERGTGLGLLLSKEMVDRNNGTLTVESVPNAGSTFTVRLPATRSQEEEE